MNILTSYTPNIAKILVWFFWTSWVLYVMPIPSVSQHVTLAYWVETAKCDTIIH